MPVSDQKVLKKMLNEVQLAYQEVDDIRKVKEHVRSIRTLCDLLLDEESSTSEEVVLKKMQEEQPVKENDSSIDHEDANGTSIFDF